MALPSLQLIPARVRLWLRIIDDIEQPLLDALAAGATMSDSPSSFDRALLRLPTLAVPMTAVNFPLPLTLFLTDNRAASSPIDFEDRNDGHE
jgi:hypothetical protein